MESADDILGSAMQRIESVVAPIRASNTKNMETANGIRKTQERKLRTGQVTSGKRKRADEEGESSARKAPKPPPAVTMADAKYQSQRHQQAQQATKSYMVKMNQLGRFRASKILWPWLLANGDRTILNGPEGQEKDLDKKLSHIDAVTSTSNAAAKMKECIYGVCAAFESYSGKGELVGMNLDGYADDVYCHLDEVEMELEIMRCKYGDWFSVPWYVSLGLFFSKRAAMVHQRNGVLRGPANNSSDGNDN